MVLSLANYHLKKVAEKNEMLFIKHLEFSPQLIYAITGTIGTGKTTLLSDITECLTATFNSNGQIFYPCYQGQALAKIFCGIISFAPPATALFETINLQTTC